MLDEIVDDIYEAAFIPELWPSVIESLGQVSVARSGSLLIMDGRSEPRWKATDLIEEALGSFVESGTWRTCAMAANAPSLLHRGFVLDTDVLTREAIAADPAHQMQRSLGLGSQLACVLQMPTEEFVVWTLEHDLRSDAPDAHAVEQLNGFVSHLARSSLIAARLKLTQAQTMVATMERLGLPAAVLRAGGRVLAVNAAFEALDSLFVARAFGKLTLVAPKADVLLQSALAELPGNASAAVRSIPVPASDEHGAMVVHVLPLRRSALDIFSGGGSLVVATAVTASNLIPSPTLLSGLFDLAPAEAKLVAALATGVALKQAAAEQNIRTTTARYYLEQIFRKTGTHRQGELVALVKSTLPLHRAD